MVHVEGKKLQGRVLDAKEIYNFVCPECGIALVKLETETGRPYSGKKGVYYDFYWICLCPNGHGKFKVKDKIYKMYMEGK